MWATQLLCAASSHTQTPEREFLLRVSYLEIYNEEIRDLLCPSSTKLEIREDIEVTRLLPFVFGSAVCKRWACVA